MGLVNRRYRSGSVDCGKLLISCVISFCLLARNGQAQQSLADGPALIGHLMMPDREVAALFDTASDYTIFDSSIESQLGDPLHRGTIKTIGANVATTFYSSPKLMLHKQVLRPDPVGVIDFTSLRNTSGIDLKCVVGIDVLAQGILRLDNHQGIWSWSQERFVPGKGFFKVNLVPHSNKKYAISIDVPEVGPTLFVVDTGYVSVSGTGHLSQELAKRLDAGDQLVPLRNTRTTSVAGDRTNQTGLLRFPLTIGPVKLTNAIFTKSNKLNLVGMNFLSRFETVVFDFPKREMYIDPGNRFDRPEVVDRTGLRIWRPDHVAAVFEVQPGSPGADSKIQPGDLITHLNNQPTQDMALNKLRLLLSGPLLGELKFKSVELRIRRGVREFTAKVPLDIWPEPPDLRPRKRLPQDTDGKVKGKG